MQSLAFTSDRDYYTRAANEDCVNGGPRTRTKYGYDALSRPSSMTYLDSTTVGFDYEADDDLQTLTHNFNGGGLVLSYTHNGAHQILSMVTSDPSYLMKQVGPTTAYTKNTLNQYNVVGASSMTYDANGNLGGDGVWTYSYDEENRLRRAVGNGSTAIYSYDPLSRRRSKTVNGTTTYYVFDGPNELAELGSTGSRLRFYLNAGTIDDRIGMYDDTLGSWRFYHANLQGSILFTTSYPSAGTILDQYHYGAFGEPASTDTPTGNAIRYTGRYFDAETGLYYYRSRYYSSKLGRFLQTDTIGTKDDLNLYTYTGNDPLDRTDPSGNCPSCLGALVGGGLELGIQLLSPEGRAAYSAAISALGRGDVAGAVKAAGAEVTKVALSAAAGALGVGIAGKVGEAASVLSKAADVGSAGKVAINVGANAVGNAVAGGALGAATQVGGNAAAMAIGSAAPGQTLTSGVTGAAIGGAVGGATGSLVSAALTGSAQNLATATGSFIGSPAGIAAPGVIPSGADRLGAIIGSTVEQATDRCAEKCR